MEDRRWLVRHQGRDAIVADLLSSARGVHVASEVIAAAGDELLLTRHRVDNVGDRSFVIEFLSVTECHDDRVTALQWLAGDDLDEARRHFEARAAELLR